MAWRYRQSAELPRNLQVIIARHIDGSQLAALYRQPACDAARIGQFGMVRRNRNFRGYAGLGYQHWRHSPFPLFYPLKARPDLAGTAGLIPERRKNGHQSIVGNQPVTSIDIAPLAIQPCSGGKLVQVRG